MGSNFVALRQFHSIGGGSQLIADEFADIEQILHSLLGTDTENVTCFGHSTGTQCHQHQYLVLWIRYDWLTLIVDLERGWHFAKNAAGE